MRTRLTKLSAMLADWPPSPSEARRSLQAIPTGPDEPAGREGEGPAQCERGQAEPGCEACGTLAGSACARRHRHAPAGRPGDARHPSRAGRRTGGRVGDEWRSAGDIAEAGRPGEPPAGQGHAESGPNANHGSAARIVAALLSARGGSARLSRESKPAAFRRHSGTRNEQARVPRPHLSAHERRGRRASRGALDADHRRLGFVLLARSRRWLRPRRIGAQEGVPVRVTRCPLVDTG